MWADQFGGVCRQFRQGQVRTRKFSSWAVPPGRARCSRDAGAMLDQWLSRRSGVTKRLLCISALCVGVCQWFFPWATTIFGDDVSGVGVLPPWRPEPPRLRGGWPLYLPGICSRQRCRRTRGRGFSFSTSPRDRRGGALLKQTAT